MYLEAIFRFYVLLYHFVGHSFLGLVFFGSFSDIIKRNFSLTLTKLNFYVDMSVWLFVGKQYYRLNGTFVVPTKFLCLPVSKIHRKTKLYVLQESAIWLLLLINVHLFYKTVKKFFLLQVGELII